AKRQPTTRHDLEALRDFNRPALLRKSEEILRLVASAREVPADKLPEHGERHEEGPGLTMLVNLLAAGLSHCCTQEEVAVGLVGTASDLKELVRWHAEGKPDSRVPDLARGWRASVCGQTLLAMLDGQIALRVRDPAAEVPVALEELAPQPRRIQAAPRGTTD
ncbi:MAG TPA: ribonuclease D, partial [Isosphaeraceae bacterium]|nr:ribonuclease D [Isosphaeraceae bacterium]